MHTKIYPHVSSLAVSGYLMHVQTKTKIGFIGMMMQIAHFFLDMPQSMMPLEQRSIESLHQ